MGYPVGQSVTAGAPIGLSGNTGCSMLPHLHFQLDRITATNNGKVATVDPYGWTGTSTDPWAANPRGATSLNLWFPGKAPQMFIGLDSLCTGASRRESSRTSATARSCISRTGRTT